MKCRWEEKSLGEIIKLEYGKPLSDDKRIPDGKYPVYGANGEKDRTNEFYYDKPSIIVGRKGSAGEVNLTEKRFWPLDVTYFVTFDEKKYNLKFIFNLLLTLNLPKLAKGVKPGINRNEVYGIAVKTPPLPEQERLVVIFDGIFEKVAKAKENAEENLQNARELFESYLQSIFANPGEDLEEKKLGDICEVIAGQSPEGKYYNNSGKGLPFYQGKKEFTEKYLGVPTTWTTNITKEAQEGDILMSVRAPVGPVNFSTSRICIGRGLAAIRASKHIDKEFLFNFLIKHKNEIVGNAGAVFNSISKTQIENILIPLPSIPKQKIIVDKLITLSTETKRLEIVYQQKLADLEELKKSVLHKAFNGGLVGVGA
ncbi:restriction modification system DNA specificity domain-containing protein [Candidatus Omnitrophus magneticus]|uniref:Restriction modification system DNA specificity domain-containing protein n=1 Tax=Candidatus Omnitrophus magneticus TaxID=1609969 RepID=A0A0F0CQ20_9BACT|nr:restriction modification system DNA specificity domain-containing protein [Candidatus Omnitrophus magneticus]